MRVTFVFALTLCMVHRSVGRRPHDRRLYVGILGHADHGKTTLTSAITKVQAKTGQAVYRTYGDIDNAPARRSGAVTFNASIADYFTDSRYYSLVDYPTHTDFVKNAIIGMFPMEGAILVVSALDSPMPQTRDQISLARQIGIPALVVYLSKVDQVDDEELLELVEMEVRELLSAYDFPGDETPVISGCALCAFEDMQEYSIGREAILELVRSVDEYIPTPPRGPGSADMQNHVEAQVYLLTPEEGGPQRPLTDNYRAQMFSNTGDSLAVINLPEGVEMVMPGDNAQLIFTLLNEMALSQGTRFTLRDGRRTLGYGVVTEVLLVS